jgi:signal transduction histidine kinase
MTRYLVGAPASASRSAVAIGGLAVFSAVWMAAELWFRPHVADAGLRGALETAITSAALLSAILIRQRLRHTRLVRDLLLLAALTIVLFTDLIFAGLPAVSGSHAFAHGSGARMTVMTLLAGAFVAIAFGPAGRRFPIGSRLPILVPAAAIVIVAAAGAIDLTFGFTRSVSHTAVDVVTVLASCAMLIAGIRFAIAGPSDRLEAGLLAATAFLLADGWMQKLAWPLAPADWVTLGDVARLAGYGLLLAAAIRLSVRTREEQARDAIVAERLRIAGDLHDGLAQDLAFIAAHSGRLAAELGAEHPVAIAAQRALAVSRREILDLEASRAASLEAALREVATELAHRFGVEVRCTVDDGADLDVSLTDRHELVRIAREAIVNAAQHGGARHIDLALGSRRSGLLLRVADDGCGLDVPAPARSQGTGLGLRMMRARARAMGGELVVAPREGRGTEIAVTAPAQDDAPSPGVGSRPRFRRIADRAPG